MTDKYGAFVSYLLETLNEEFDENNVRHITYQAMFYAGWDAGRF